MELGMEPGMELGIERDRRTRNRGAVLVTERRVTQRKRGLEPHPEMGESKEVYSLRGGGDLFFSDVAVVDVSKLLFGTWIGNRLNRVALSMPAPVGI
ncbi:unnamed protein product [Sphagnum jensenii]|uniref:Uncharacterized protein n=1 Tax=Sphagnum jensenii TaxID=128206 RepID=A0ABP1AVW6_9BRYO